MITLVLAVAESPSIFDWTGLANTLLGIVGTVAALLISIWRWLKTPLTKAIEEQGHKLDEHGKTLSDLVNDVREVRTNQSGLDGRVSSLERRMDGQSPPPFWRR